MMRNDEETNKTKIKRKKATGELTGRAQHRLFSNGQIREKLKEMLKKFRRGEDFPEE